MRRKPIWPLTLQSRLARPVDGQRYSVRWIGWSVRASSRRAHRVQTWLACCGRGAGPSSVPSIGGVSASPVASIHGASAPRVTWVGGVLALPRHAQRATSGVQTGVQAIRGRARGSHLVAEVGAQRQWGSRKRPCGHVVDGRHPGSWRLPSLTRRRRKRALAALQRGTHVLPMGFRDIGCQRLARNSTRRPNTPREEERTAEGS